MFRFDVFLALVAVVAALISAGLMAWLAWRLWGRPLATARAQTSDLEKRLTDRDAKFEAALGALAQEKARADALEPLREELHQARMAMARLDAQSSERERGLNEQIQQLQAMQAALDAHLQQTAAQAFTQSQETFLGLANETFAKHREGAGADLARLIEPMAEQLKRAEAQITALENQRREAFGALTVQIDLMRQDQDKVGTEARRLTQALKSSAKLRGSWGEQQLRNVLEMAGLSPFVDFQTEVTVAREDDRQRPDAVVRLPGGRSLIIDAKTSLSAFQAATETDDETRKRELLSDHAAAMKLHAKQLGGKKYWEQFDQTPDFVVMFVPGEHFLSAAMEQDPTLWDYAFEHRILIASPINLIALARSVAHVWRESQMADTAREIADLARDLYRRLAKMGDRVQKMGSALDSAVKTYNDFVGTLETSVLPQARKFRELGVEGAEEPIVRVDPLDRAARLPAPNRDLDLTPPPTISAVR